MSDIAKHLSEGSLEEFREVLVAHLAPYVKRIAIFGSFARGEEQADSDLDVLLSLKDPQDRPVLGLKLFALEQELSRQFGRNVEFVTDKAISRHLRQVVNEEKVLLYED